MRTTKEPIRKAHTVGSSVVVTIDPSHVKRLNIDDLTFFVQKSIQHGILLEVKRLQDSKDESNEGENKNKNNDVIGGEVFPGSQPSITAWRVNSLEVMPLNSKIQYNNQEYKITPDKKIEVDRLTYEEAKNILEALDENLKTQKEYEYHQLSEDLELDSEEVWVKAGPSINIIKDPLEKPNSIIFQSITRIDDNVLTMTRIIIITNRST
jgi:hypothetical protein